MTRTLRLKAIKFVISVLLIGLAGLSQAMPGYPASPMGPHMMGQGGMPYPGARQGPGPGAELKAGMNKLMAFFKSNRRASSTAIKAFLETEIAPAFDFDYMAKMAAGPMARQMNPGQRKSLAAKIKKEFLGVLVQRLASYSGQSVKYLAPRMGRNRQTASASVAIMNPAGYPARLEFRFYLSSAGWKVYDVSANGQSAVLHFRRQFRNMIRSTPPSISR